MAGIAPIRKIVLTAAAAGLIAVTFMGANSTYEGTIVTVSAATTLTAAPGKTLTSTSRTTYIAKCQYVRYGGGGAGTIGYITGYGYSTEEALRDVDRQVPRGHYKRHCQIRRSGGGRF
jgi:hypothetical protein